MRYQLSYQPLLHIALRRYPMCVMYNVIERDRHQLISGSVMPLASEKSD